MTDFDLFDRRLSREERMQIEAERAYARELEKENAHLWDELVKAHADLYGSCGCKYCRRWRRPRES